MESVRLGEPVTPADRPVAAERDAEIRVRSEVWWKRLQGGARDGKQGFEGEGKDGSDEGQQEPSEPPVEVLYSREIRQTRRDLFIATSFGDDHGRLLGMEADAGGFSVGAFLKEHQPEDAVDRDALEAAAERFVSFHVRYDYPTNSYAIQVPKLSRELAKSLEATANREERLWLIQAVLDAAIARAPDDKAAVSAALQPLLSQPTPVSTPVLETPEPVPLPEETTEPGRGVSVNTDIAFVHMGERLIRATFYNEDDEPTVTEFDERTSATSTATASVMGKTRQKRGGDRRKKPRGKKDRRRRR